MTNMSKSEKVQILFLCVHFFKFFNGFEISLRICVFDFHIELLNQIVFALISTFSKHGMQKSMKRLKKTETFLWTYFRINLGNQQRIRTTKMLKSLDPTVHLHLLVTDHIQTKKGGFYLYCSVIVPVAIQQVYVKHYTHMYNSAFVSVIQLFLRSARWCFCAKNPKVLVNPNLSNTNTIYDHWKV